jgi:hypothetical protein
MIVVGGYFPYDKECDSPEIWGTHSLDLSSIDPNATEWTDFRPSGRNYSVPLEIIAVIGGK